MTGLDSHRTIVVSRVVGYPDTPDPEWQTTDGDGPRDPPGSGHHLCAAIRYLGAPDRRGYCLAGVLYATRTRDQMWRARDGREERVGATVPVIQPTTR